MDHQSHEETQPKTAVEEAMVRLIKAHDLAIREKDKLGFFSFRSRSYYKGVIFTLGITLELLHGLMHKYDNANGRMN